MSKNDLAPLYPENRIHFDKIMRTMLNEGWSIELDGVTGVQIGRTVKEWRMLDKICLVVGALLLFFMPGFGVLFICLALIDYYFYPESYAQFIYRPSS